MKIGSDILGHRFQGNQTKLLSPKYTDRKKLLKKTFL